MNIKIFIIQLVFIFLILFSSCINSTDPDVDECKGPGKRVYLTKLTVMPDTFLINDTILIKINWNGKAGEYPSDIVFEKTENEYNILTVEMIEDTCSWSMGHDEFHYFKAVFGSTGLKTINILDENNSIKIVRNIFIRSGIRDTIFKWVLHLIDLYDGKTPISHQDIRIYYESYHKIDSGGGLKPSLDPVGDSLPYIEVKTDSVGRGSCVLTNAGEDTLYYHIILERKDGRGWGLRRLIGIQESILIIRGIPESIDGIVY